MTGALIFISRRAEFAAADTAKISLSASTPLVDRDRANIMPPQAFRRDIIYIQYIQWAK